MNVPRRRFLGLLISPAAVGVHPEAVRANAGGAADRQATATGRAELDPQIARLRAIGIDDQVEPILICVPGLE